MDKQNLNTASVYVNNLLLSRGLLRNGTAIEFARPSKAEGGPDATMAEIINLVHDLILRRDRETNTLSTISQNLQSLHSSAEQQTQTIGRLENRATDLDRQLALAVAQERAAKVSLRTAEIRNRGLREEMGKLKATVTQIRAQCANDIRKRDGEIKRMKRHLEGRKGREGGAAQVGVVVITPSLSKSHKKSMIGHSEADLQSSDYSLKQETTNFLTELSRNLSSENDALTHLVKDTCVTLRTLQGLPLDEREAVVASIDEGRGVLDDPNVVLNIPPSYERLADNMEEVLEHLRGLLTNPSFVPLEELEVREDEIIRLREGWEKMEARWREAVALMHGWKKRMMETGDTVNLEDLRRGLTLDTDTSMKAESDANEIPIIEEATDESLVSETDSFVHPEESEVNDRSAMETENELGIGLFPPPNVPRSTSGNKRRSLSPRKVSFRTGVTDPNSHTETSGTADEISLLNFDTFSPSKEVASFEWPSENKQGPEGTALTVQQKLEIAQAEGEEARKREESTNTEKKSCTLASSKLRPGRRKRTLSQQELEGLLGYS